MYKGIVSMLKMKNILCDVIDNTYGNSEKKELYKKFYIEMINERRKGFHGDYNGLTHRIRIFNLYRDDNSIVATTIHELAHHIDMIDNGATNHGKEFYDRFRQLLYTALNMKLFSKEQFLLATKDASDSNKIAKMLNEWTPQDIGYKKDVVTLELFNCYAQKEKIKAYGGYIWNGVNKVWEKELPVSEVDKEKLFLENNGINYRINTENTLSFNGKKIIFAGKGSYDVKDKLFADGFRYSKNKKGWEKEITTETLKDFSKKYPTVEFKYL